MSDRKNTTNTNKPKANASSSASKTPKIKELSEEEKEETLKAALGAGTKQEVAATAEETSIGIAFRTGPKPEHVDPNTAGSKVDTNVLLFKMFEKLKNKPFC